MPQVVKAAAGGDATASPPAGPLEDHSLSKLHTFRKDIICGRFIEIHLADAWYVDEYVVRRYVYMII